MFRRIKYNLKDNRRKITAYFLKKKLKNDTFSIISNNCWGGLVYQDFDLKYSSPFVGLFVVGEDYIKLLQNLKYYLGCKLVFESETKHQYLKGSVNQVYPIGLLDDIEIHFLHYKTENEARTKWEKRLKRLNWDNLYVKYSETKTSDPDLIKEFDNLPFSNKICFTANKYPNLKSSIQITEFENKGYLEDYLKKYKKYFNVIDWLNCSQ